MSIVPTDDRGASSYLDDDDDDEDEADGDENKDAEDEDDISVKGSVADFC
jgi:hypothetical protein